MSWKKNDLFQLKIEDMSDTGEGIGKVEGYTWFVKDGVIGDVVEAKAMKTKKSYGFARMMRVIEPSPHRVEPACAVARPCGGCQLQALAYEEQLRFKERKIRNNLQRIGSFQNLVSVEESGRPQTGESTLPDNAIAVYPIIGMEHPWRYRNKAQFPFGRNKEGRIIAGFYAGRTHDIIEQEDCLIGVEENPVILTCIKEFMEEYQIAPYEETSHTGLVRHALIRKGFQTGELMVCLVLNGTPEQLKQPQILVERLRGLFAQSDAVTMTSISCSLNRERTNVIMGRELVNLYGPGYITDYIGTVQYRISPLSFYQVNPVQTRRLYETALEYAGLTGDETVWDLYCGIGTISLFLAQRAKQVFGVEIVPQAIDDARENARLNGMDNVKFFVGKAEEVLPEQYEKDGIYADIIVVDPPRKGCDQVCLDTIVKMEPRRVVYVSCDSATLARDLRYLCDRGYEVKKVRGCDLFPGSGHIEVVVLLTRNLKPKYEIDITIPMEEGEPNNSKEYNERKKATYPKIKDYIKNTYGVNTHTRDIAEVRRKCGLDMRENYNKSKKENPKIRQTTPEKAEYIKDALKHLNAI